MIPAWKLRREWERLKQQLRAIPEAFSEPALQRRHDAAYARGFKTQTGHQPLSDNIVVLLLFQPNGLSDSTFETIQLLADRGYAVFIVSNAILSDNDTRSLAPLVWRIMERPNFGYDFGGYRDGIRTLFDQGITPENLIILNDSVWFPSDDPKPFFDHLKGVNTGLGGAILRESRDIRFLESYFFAVPKLTFQHPAFRAYWDRLKLTSNKYKVIRRGERQFSEQMALAGLPLQPAYPYAPFFSQLSDQSDDFLYKTLIYASHIHDHLEESRKALLDDRDATGWRARVLAHCHDAALREQPYSCFPFAMTNLMSYPFLKKSGDRVAVMWRKAFLEGVDAGDIPAPPTTILNELRCKVTEDVT